MALQINCSSLNYTTLGDCIFESVTCDYYQLLNLVLKTPFDSLDKLYNHIAKSDPNIKLRLCKLGKSLMSFSKCNKDDYIAWRIFTLYGRTFDSKQLCPVKTPFCISQPDFNYKALSKLSTIISAIQTPPDTNVTASSLLEFVTLIFKTLCPTEVAKLPQILTVIQLAAFGCRLPCAPFTQATIPVDPGCDCVMTPASPMTVYQLNGEAKFDFSLLSIFGSPAFFSQLSKLKLYSLIFYIAYTYMCNIDALSCLCATQITVTTTPSTAYTLCGTTLTPIIASCLPTDLTIPLYALSPLGDTLVSTVKKLYGTFSDSVCDCPCPDVLFKYLMKYSPEYNTQIKREYCIEPIISNVVSYYPKFFEEYESS